MRKKGENENRGKEKSEVVSIGETMEETDVWKQHRRASQVKSWKIDDILEQIGKIEEGLTSAERAETIETWRLE